ncbi:MAG: hypothetical protein GY699_13595 [Desulfobacteraceae bacterium]|nr:hypothetical protein [Desulfobacteraceae bacterium]
MTQLKKFLNGKINLWKTFWIYGVSIPIIFYFLGSWLVLNYILPHRIQFLLYPMMGSFVLYSTIVWVAIWRSAGKYTGPKIWPLLAKGSIAISMVIILYLSYSIYFISNILSVDAQKNSYNIKNHLNYDVNYPYVGFWKTDCSNDFGLAIDKKRDGFYTISFCGPGGCFKKDSYRSSTKLINDPNYKVLNKNTIEIINENGLSMYRRCEK